MNPPNPEEIPAENPEEQPVASGPESESVSPVQPEPEEEVIDINMGCLREVAVEIPAEVVNKEFDSTVQRYTKIARVPGFRKGKVPASIVRNRYANEIRSDVLESLIPKYFREAVVKEGFKPISEPHVHSLENEPGQAVRFKAAFEIKPDIELGNYQEMKLDVPEIKVTDEDVDAELKNLQERQASFDPVDEDRPLQDGDFAQISFEALPREATSEAPRGEQSENAAQPEPVAAKPAANQPVKVDEVFVEIGGANTQPEFSTNLRGGKVGEERTFDVTYPSDYFDNRLAGKTLSYNAKINAIKKKITPALTDDFAKELSPEMQTLDDLKKRLHEGILAERQHRAMHEAREKLLNQLAESHEFPVPETLIRTQIDFRLEQWLRSLAAQGMRTEDMKRMDFKRLRSTQREAATKEVKANLLLERIAEAENIQATDDEVRQQVHAMAQQAKETPEAMEHRLVETGGLERIRRRIRSDKALRFLYDKSTSNARNGAIQE